MKLQSIKHKDRISTQKKTIQFQGKMMNSLENLSYFIPDDYKEPSRSEDYMKLQVGENRIRILSPMVQGWQDWDESTKKPARFHFNEKPKKPIDPKKPVQLFWAFVVWNYAESKIQILNITQVSIRKSISKLASDIEEWGNPYFYDIKITKITEKDTTTYTVVPCKHSNVSEAIKKAFQEKPANLEALFYNQDPFEVF